MKKLITIAILILGAMSLKAQPLIKIPFDLTTVTIDGQINFAEWEHADTLRVPLGTNDTITVYYKHDMQNLYFAFFGKLESNSLSQMFPEVLVDPQYARGSAWSSGQWWFHVSATDCENDGAYGIYNNCMATQPGWQGVPNFSPGPPYTDSVEMKIPYSKIGFNAVTQYRMGLAVCITNTNNVFDLWPTAADRNVPSTWSEAHINKFPVNITNVEQVAWKVYPNPATNIINVSGVQKGAQVVLYDVYGKKMHEQIATDSKHQINTATIPSGVYYLNVQYKGELATQKVIVTKQ